MKRLNSIFISIVVVLAFSACDILDSQEPRQSLPLDQLYSTTDDLENALTGAYSDVQSGDAMGSSYPLFGELMGENVNWVGSFEQWGQIGGHDIDLTNSQVEAVWNQTYEALNDVNLIIEAVDADEIDDDAFVQSKDRIKGEALFLRAMLHFEAVRMWAKPWGYTSDNSHAGIPVVTSGVQTADNFKTPERSSVAAVYDQVITDLNDAISLLSSYDAGSSARANEYNVQAYLARVYMQQGEFADALPLTEAVMNSNEYGLEGAPQDYFFTPSEESSGESVFDIVHTDQDNPGVNNSLSTFYNGTNGGRGDITVTSDYTNALAAATANGAQELEQQNPDYTYEDLRSTELLSPSGFTLKYEDGVNVADNAPIIRYADVLLMRAEALAETAGTYPSAESNEAIDLLNQVHLRSIRVYNENGGSEDASQWFAYEETDFTSNDELLEAIRLERQVELGFEGKRKHDLVRWGMDVTSGTSGAVTAPDADNLTWPIPESELDANDSICQNAGYGGADTCE